VSEKLDGVMDEMDVVFIKELDAGFVLDARFIVFRLNITV
jgi:hypothetical protein